MSADPVDLLREVPLPEDPFDRYAGVVARRRRGDRRRYAVVSASLATVLVAAGISAVALRSPDTKDLSSVLTSTPSTAHITGSTVKDGAVMTRYEGDLDLAGKRFALSITTQGTTVRLITIGKDTWFGTGLSTQARPWVHSTSALAGATSKLDPTRLYQELRSAGATVTALGQAEVDGVSTTRYRVVLDKPGEDTVFQGGSGEVFVDDAGYVRRMVETADGAVTTAEFSDFGKPVTITPPPADQVQEQPDLSSFGGPGASTSCTGAQATPTAPPPSGFGVRVHTEPYCVTIQGGSTPSMTPEQKRVLCQGITKEFEAALKAHPERRAMLEGMKAQLCSG
jgi:hypothetical protein